LRRLVRDVRQQAEAVTMAFILLGLLLVVGFFPRQVEWLCHSLYDKLADWHARDSPTSFGRSGS
jgi:hypothetical protein